MKNILVCFLFVFMIFSATAQDITLTFNGTGAASSVDSVIAFNQTINQRVSVAGNILQLNSTVSSSISLYDNAEVTAHPNPFTDEVIIVFPVEKAGDVKVTIINTLGQTVTQTIYVAKAGENKIAFTAGDKGIFVAQIITPTQSFKISLMSTDGTSGANTIRYFGNSANTGATHQSLKSVQTVYMSYTPGDRILFILKSGNYAKVISDIPTQTKSYDVLFVPCTDGDNNNYPTVQIGTQIWMAENLKTTKYNDGTAIPLVTDATAWKALITPAYCYYNNDSATYKATYGPLYNWYVVDTASNGGKNVCPIGWHVPSDTELTTMENYLIANGYNYDGTTTSTYSKIGKSLAATTNWTFNNYEGTVGNTDYPAKRNLTGFSALPGGYREYEGSYHMIGTISIWWSSKAYDAKTAWYYYLAYTNEHLRIHYDSYKTIGYSVRCLRDN